MKKISILILVTLLFISNNMFADDFFDDLGSEVEGGVVSNLEFNGEVVLGTEFTITEDSIEAIDNTADTADAYLDTLSGDFKIKYTGDVADLTVTFEADQDGVNIDEAYANIYLDTCNFEVGYLKTIWGKGDKLHVLDLLNPTDYSNYFTQDYLDNKMAQPTLKLNKSIGDSGMLELAYIPTFEADNIPTEGKWVPAQAKVSMEAIETAVKADAKSAYATAFTTAYVTAITNGDTVTEATASATGAAMAASLAVLEAGQDLDQYYPDMNTLSYGQAGARFTSSVAGYDFGAMYYFGYEKQPTFDLTTMKFVYNSMNVAGLEFGTILAGFNLRAEAAYYFINNADDTFNYLGGFDRDLPLHNVNLNVQVKGAYNVESEEIANMLVGKISDSFNHEKVTPSVTAIFNVEDEDFLIKPELSVKLGDNINITTSAGIFSGEEDTTLGYYDSQDYLKLTLKYTF